MIEPMECPACGVDLRDGEIPERYRQDFDPQTHWTRAEPARFLDEDVWLCPDCEAVWPV